MRLKRLLIVLAAAVLAIALAGTGALAQAAPPGTDWPSSPRPGPSRLFR